MAKCKGLKHELDKSEVITSLMELFGDLPPEMIVEALWSVRTQPDLVSEVISCTFLGVRARTDGNSAMDYAVKNQKRLGWGECLHFMTPFKEWMKWAPESAFAWIDQANIEALGHMSHFGFGAVLVRSILDGEFVDSGKMSLLARLAGKPLIQDQLAWALGDEIEKTREPGWIYDEREKLSVEENRNMIGAVAGALAGVSVGESYSIKEWIDSVGDAQARGKASEIFAHGLDHREYRCVALPCRHEIAHEGMGGRGGKGNHREHRGNPVGWRMVGEAIRARG